MRKKTSGFTLIELMIT
ncbi:MAG: prepilin-type N-terminal cleavage/methylation domain-containing protein, partial [Marinobacter salsuginis]